MCCVPNCSEAQLLSQLDGQQRGKVDALVKHVSSIRFCILPVFDAVRCVAPQPALPIALCMSRPRRTEPLCVHCGQIDPLAGLRASVREASASLQSGKSLLLCHVSLPPTECCCFRLDLFL